MQKKRCSVWKTSFNCRIPAFAGMKYRPSSAVVGYGRLTTISEPWNTMFYIYFLCMNKKQYFKILVFVVLCMLLASCGLEQLFTTGGTDPSSYNKTYHDVTYYPQHVPLKWNVKVEKKRDDITISVSSVIFNGNESDRYYTCLEVDYEEDWWDSCVKDYYSIYEVRRGLLSDTLKTVNADQYFNKMVDGKKNFYSFLDSANHFNAVLLDSAGDEKVYDLDLSPIIEFLNHPFEVRGDSVDLLVPAGISDYKYNYNREEISSCPPPGVVLGYRCSFEFENAKENSIVSTDIASVFLSGYLEAALVLENVSIGQTDTVEITGRYYLY